MEFNDFVLVTCEHASDKVPDHLLERFNAKSWDPHQIFDGGAHLLASHLCESLQTTLLAGQYSRLVVDLNRSESHPGITKLLETGPGGELTTWLEEYYRPFRAQVQEEVEKRLPCIHISVHSFTRVLGGKVRQTDIGVLYDPKSAPEKTLSQNLLRFMKPSQFKVRANSPYKGTSDGHTTALREIFSGKPYIGIELEVCDDLLTGQFEVIFDLLNGALKEHLSRGVFGRS